MIQLKIECGECGQLHTLRHGRLGTIALLCHGCERQLAVTVRWHDVARISAQRPPRVLTLVAHAKRAQCR